MAGNYNYGGNGGYREWMYKRFDEVTGNLSAEYVAGVEEFMTFANSQPIVQSNRGKFHCPCSVCKNEKHMVSGRRVSSHLFSQGFMPDYYVWYRHGEELNMDIGTSYTDRTYQSENHEEDGSYQNIEEPVRNHSNKFYDLLEGAQNPLYDGCREGQSQLSLAARLMQNKAEYNMSEKLVDSVCQMFTDFLPEGNQATGSHYQTEKLMRNLGLPYHTIDVCMNNCMLFWKETEKEDQCRFCGAQRWKPKDDRRRTKVPYSRMWYLPIGDRLKRMYQSHKTAAAMRWHAEHQSKEGEMNHPSDAAEWRYFQEQNPEFAEEPRNVYLGLCTDGFNPFGISRNHSLWPVILTPYNLPQGMCMNTEYLFLTILNSGPNHPRGSLDVFLQPLIEELKELWSTGVDAFDVSLNQNFNLKAVLMWTISDFPAYSMLSGWTTHENCGFVVLDNCRIVDLFVMFSECWKCVPRDRQERYFLEFAKTHTWDPLITGTVQYHFEQIIGRRMKDMVSGVRTSRVQPTWIRKTIWETMCAYWDTAEAQEKSKTYSNARMSDRNGLGPHIHFSGPKSFQEIQDDMEEELGRPVSLGEVFIKTHTRPDGTYVDQKAEKIAKTYEQNVLDRLNELEADTSAVSDGASRPRELTTEEYTTIFLQSTERDARGNPYGIGSLKNTLVSGNRKYPGDSSSFQALEEQLKDAHRKIEEQVAYNERRESEVASREAEQARVAAEQKDKLEHLSLVEKYLRQTDPQFLHFMATHSSSAGTTEPIPQQDP
ncbi:putative transposase Ptta/En/Spm plant [Arabidopsis thaliana x Arabidopsis arenosa]|uniref:Putative transposase Ptta/En/Spm plant n=1 Tax=Arabidopsis thaliana x Arabidopsis arenosa TaxID=1240361 RepID=A0A8T1Y7R3_9BRAS|nr:putative transposase Ptta/En/Spm plant [Arabidopsis thaliana x Arabidopsis arenosa]